VKRYDKEKIMLKRQIATLIFTGALLLLCTVPAFAGGWAIVTLDDLPRTLNAGETVTLGFIVRQHGVTPVNLENVLLTATGPDGESLAFTARQVGEEGHYVVDVTLPSAGEWAWEIQPDWFAATAFAPIAVLDTAATAPPLLPTNVPRTFLSQWVTRIGRLGTNWFLGVESAMGATQLPVARVTQPVNNKIVSALMNDIAYGRALFIAKGCNACHLHDAALNTWSAEVGPDLTDYQLPADYLRAWLTDPKPSSSGPRCPTWA